MTGEQAVRLRKDDAIYVTHVSFPNLAEEGIEAGYTVFSGRLASGYVRVKITHHDKWTRDIILKIYDVPIRDVHLDLREAYARLEVIIEESETGLDGGYGLEERRAITNARIKYPMSARERLEFQMETNT